VNATDNEPLDSVTAPMVGADGVVDSVDADE